MLTLSTRERDAFHRDMARRMAKPKALRDLEDQAERLEREKARAVEGFFHDLEAKRLREKIRDMGETPCA